MATVGDELEVVFTRLPDTVVTRLAGVIDLAATPRLEATFTNLLDARPRGDLVADVSAVRLIDAASASTLLRVHAHALGRDRRFRMVGARGRALEMLRVTGAASILDADHPPPRSTTTGMDPDSGWRRYAPVDTVQELVHAAAELSADDPNRTRAHRRVVELCAPVATHLAFRYRNSGQPVDDLAQVASMGLAKAARGFDPALGTDFLGYAVPTILGELRRYFRDATWSVHVPRRLQNLRRDVTTGRETLTQHLGRAPTRRELARHLDLHATDIDRVELAAANYRTLSLDHVTGTDAGTTVLDTIGWADDSYERIDNHHSLSALLAQLPERQRHILGLRFVKEYTQQEIATELGISQMHVSRLLSRTLATLRSGLLHEDSDGRRS